MKGSSTKIQATAMVSPKERERIIKAAQKEYLSLSAFMRKVVLEYLDRKGM